MTLPYVDCNSDVPWCHGCDRRVAEVCYDCGHCEDCCACGPEAWEDEPGGEKTGG